MMTTSTRNERRPLVLSPNDDRKEVKDYYEEISGYCIDKQVSSFNYDAHVSNGVEFVEETIKSFNINRDIEQLATKAQALHSTLSNLKGKAIVLTPEKKFIFQDKENAEGNRSINSKKKKKTVGKGVLTPTKVQALHSTSSNLKGRGILTPDRKYVSQDKENTEGKRSINSKKKKKVGKGALTPERKYIDSKKKNGGKGKLLRQKLTTGLEDELKRKDDQLHESQTMADAKDQELEDVSSFMSSLKYLLHDMACTLQIDDLQLEPPQSPGATGTLQVNLKEREKEIISLNERISQLLKSSSCQGSLIESLESLNTDSVQTTASLRQLIDEKDQALAEISHFNDMNDCANKKMLAYAHEKHQGTMREIQMKHEREITSLEDTNIQLLQSMDSQASVIDSFKSLNRDLAQTITPLSQLIDEKDEALSEISHFNDINDCANRNLLVHAQKAHKEDVREHELRMKNLHNIIYLQLREKRINQRELALIKHQIEDGGEMNSQYVEDVKFVLATMSVVMMFFMALVLQKEWLICISLAYFLFVFCILE